MTIPYNADDAVRTACAQRLKRIRIELEDHAAKIAALHEEVDTLNKQLVCYPHDFVEESSYIYSIDKCSKCGAEHVV